MMTELIPAEVLDAAVEDAADAVEAHPFVTLVVQSADWVATCDGCGDVLEGGSDMDIACRSHAQHLARAVLESFIAKHLPGVVAAAKADGWDEAIEAIAGGDTSALEWKDENPYREEA